jgi:hypothetical protein
MNFVSIIKRAAPFVLTLTVGLFIASFFVTVAAPNFSFPKRNWKNKHREYDRRIEFENRQLREENSRLKNRLNEVEKRDWVLDAEINDIPAPPQPPAVSSMPMKTVPSRSR